MLSDIELVKHFLTRPVAFHRSLVPVSGSIAGAVWLGQLIYWSDGRGKDKNGWIYKTQEEWERETCLSAFEQRSVRKVLKNNGVLEEELRGIPARIYYRLNLLKLAEIVSKPPTNPAVVSCE